MTNGTCVGCGRSLRFMLNPCLACGGRVEYAEGSASSGPAMSELPHARRLEAIRHAFSTHGITVHTARHGRVALTPEDAELILQRAAGRP